MKKVSFAKILLLSAALSTCFAFQSLAEETLSGKWKGIIKTGGPELAIIANFTTEDDSYKGALDIPQQKAKGLELTDITVNDSGVSFSIRGIPGNPTFKGTFAEDDNSI